MEELRAWTIEQFKLAKSDSMDLEVRAAGRLNALTAATDDATVKIGVLDGALFELGTKVNGALNDVGVFGTIKNFVTESSMQVRMEQVDHELKLLAQHGQDFVKHLDGHLVKIEGLELEFKGHVATNFMKVEEECRRIKTALDGVSAGSGVSNSSVAQRVVALEVGMQKEVSVINENFRHSRTALSQSHC